MAGNGITNFVYDPTQLKDYSNDEDSILKEFQSDDVDVYEANYKCQPCFVYKVNIHSPNPSDVFTRNLQCFSQIPSHPCLQQFYGYHLKEFEFLASPVSHLLHTHLQDCTQDCPRDRNRRLLSDFLYNLNTFSNTDKSIFIFALACGILHLHSNRVVHRNINTRTIGINDEKLPIITSFFKSRVVNDQELLMTKITSDESIFEAPEMIENKNSHKAYDEKVDVYSYGMILQSLATNRLPFFDGLDIQLRRRQNPIRVNHQNFDLIIFSKTMEGKRPKLNAEPELKELNKLIEKCWSQNPEDRPSFSDIVIELYDKPLFPYTNKDLYKEVGSDILSKTDIPEKDKDRFEKLIKDKSRDTFITLKSKNQNNTISSEELFQLAMLWENGYGCMKKLEKAIAIYTRLSSNDNNSKFKLATLSSKQLQKTGDPNKAFIAYDSYFELISNKFYVAYIPFCQFLINYSHLLSSQLLNVNVLDTCINYLKELVDYYSNSKIMVNPKKISQGKYELAKVLLKKIEKTQINNNEYQRLIQWAEELLNESRIHYKSSNALLVELMLKTNRKKEAIELVQKEIVQNPCASIFLKYGEMYEEGIISKKDEYLALKAYETAIAKGSVIARRKAAKIYEHLDKMITPAVVFLNCGNPDYERAAELYEEAANMGDSISQNAFGLMLMEGRGVKKSNYCALTYFKEASKPTVFPPIIESMVKLGEIYYKGSDSEGVKKDKKKAKKYFTMALEQSQFVDTQSIGELLSSVQDKLNTLNNI